MAKSIKLKNNTYWDSTGVAHNQETLPNYLIKVGTTTPVNGEKVWIEHSENLLKTTLTTSTVRGITATVNSDGSVTLSGTSTGQADFKIQPDNATIFDAGDYHVSVSGIVSGVSYYFGNNNSDAGYHVFTNNLSFSYTLSKAQTIGYNLIRVEPNKTINTTIRVQIGRGRFPTEYTSTIPAFQPYLESDNIYVKNVTGTYEKYVPTKIENLLGMQNYYYASFTSRTFALNSNNEIYKTNHTIDGATWNYANSNYHIHLKAGTYTATMFFSTKETTADTPKMYIIANDDTVIANVGLTNVAKASVTFTLASDTTIGIMVKLSNGVGKIQIEKGSIAHDYVEHINSNELMYAEARMYNNQKYTSTSSWQYIKINLERIISTTSQLTVDSTNKEVVIGKNISKVLVSAKVTLTEAVTAPAILAKIYRNGVDIAEEPINETEGHTGNAFTTARVVNQMIRVTEGDTLSLIWGTNTAQNEEKTIRSSYTYMRIQAFE